MILLILSCNENNCDEKIRLYDSDTPAEIIRVCDGVKEYTSYYINGQIKAQFRNGLTHSFDSIGNLLSISESVNDTLHGLYREYFIDGKIKIESEIVRGLQSGKYREYFHHGKLKVIADFDEGVQLNFTEYHWNGTILMKAKYKKGFPIEYLKFDSLGTMIERFNAIDTTLNFKVGE